MPKIDNEHIAEIDILTLIPQRRPFVMIDRLLHFDEVLTVAQFTVREDNIFVDNGHFSATGMMENIAQTCAGRIGYWNYINGRAIQLGFIGAVRGYTVHRTALLGETLVTSIRVKEEIFQMTLVDAVVKVGDEVIAECEMKIALSDIESQQ